MSVPLSTQKKSKNVNNTIECITPVCVINNIIF